MTNAPSTRKTHITRIFGTNASGERLDDIWIDVERIDTWKSALQVAPDLQWQGVQRKYRWLDDPFGSNYEPEGNPSRDMQTLKVCDAQNEEVEDPDEWVPVKVVRTMRPRTNTGTDEGGGGRMERFLRFSSDTGLTSARVVSTRRVVHYDTNVDDQIQAALDGDASLLEYVIPADVYAKIISTKDEDQWVEYEVIQYIKTRGNTVAYGKARQVKLRNQYLIDESEAAELSVVGPGGYNPPYRLDPYQNIINCSFAPQVYVIIVVRSLLAQPNAYAVPLQDNVKVISRQGGQSDSAGLISATLLECPASVDDEILTLRVSSQDQEVFAWACPKTDSVRANWFQAFGLDGPGTVTVSLLPTEPFLWGMQGLILIGANTLNFKIRYEKHLTQRQPGQPDRMVQLYPTNGTMTANYVNVIPVHLEMSGWTAGAYRLDRKGEKTAYAIPPEWKPSRVHYEEFGGLPHFGILGLPFGIDPPLIARDVPLP